MIAIPALWLFAEPAIRRAFAPRAGPQGYPASVELPLLFREHAYRRNLQDIVAADAALGAQARRYRELKVPLVAITGNRDEFVAPSHHSAAIVREVRHGRLVVVPGVGHMPHHEEPETVVKVIEEMAGQRS